MRSMIDGFLREFGVTPRVIMEADDTEAIKRLVETGFGYSMLPVKALTGGSRFYQIYRVKGRRLCRTQALAMARTENRRALTDSIARFLRDTMTPDK
jgi:DNA-binding transcriptional LysR family regulator